MADEKAKLVLSTEVYRQIKWLTFNFDKEIGAVGVGKIKKDKEDNRHLYIEKLFFPKQEVTYATVHISPDMIHDLCKNPEFMERLKDVCFYWHKHPGTASHSSTDMKDTFETFVTKDTKWFAFLQTATKADGGMDREARIEVVRPIRTTITDEKIDLTYELPEEEKEFRQSMEKIIKTCIVEPPPTTTTTYYSGNWNKKSGRYNCQSHLPVLLENKTDEVALKQLFDIEETSNKIYFDNAFLCGNATSNEEQGSIEASNGRVLIKAGEDFEKAVQMETSIDGMLYKYIQRIRTREDKENKKKEFDIQPKRKMYEQLVEAIKTFFYNYNKKLIVEIEKSEAQEEEQGDNSEIVINDERDMAIITGYEQVSQIIVEMENFGYIEWAGFYGTVYDDFRKRTNVIGSILLGQDNSYIEIRGKELIAMLDNEQESQLNINDKMEVVGNA